MPLLRVLNLSSRLALGDAAVVIERDSVTGDDSAVGRSTLQHVLRRAPCVEALSKGFHLLRNVPCVWKRILPETLLGGKRSFLFVTQLFQLDRDGNTIARTELVLDLKEESAVEFLLDQATYMRFDKDTN